ncbi:MAG: MFS transporter [Cellulomonas sp.]
MYLSLRDRPAGPSSSKRDPGRRRQLSRVSSVVVSLGLVSLLTDISSESVAAILPLYVTAALGLSTIAYGFIDGLMQGATALVRIAGGWAADRGDHPKWVAFAGYGLSAVTRAGLLVAGGFAAVTALVAVDRIGKGIRTAPRDAMITASSDPRTLGRSFGVHRALDTVGAATGPLLAFAVLWIIPNGYSTVFVLSFGCAVIGLAILGLLVPDVRPRRAAWLVKHQTRDERGLPRCKGCTCTVPGVGPAGRPFSWAAIVTPSLRRLMLAAGALGVLTVGDGFVYLALQDRSGFATQWFPLLYVGTNVAYMSLAIPFGRLADRLGRARVFVAGHVALLAAYVCAGTSGGWAGLTFAVLLLLGVFYASTDGVLSAIVGQIAEPSARGTAIGTAQTVVALARMLASTGFGLLWYTVGRGNAMFVAAAVLALAIMACWFLVRRLDVSAGTAALAESLA